IVCIVSEAKTSKSSLTCKISAVIVLISPDLRAKDRAFIKQGECFMRLS
ncbi:unnamed protein product, partial [Brassica napus]